jgi:hypothetical protein
MIPMGRLAGYSSADRSSSYIRTVKKQMRATHCDSGGPSQLHPTCVRALLSRTSRLPFAVVTVRQSIGVLRLDHGRVFEKAGAEAD